MHPRVSCGRVNALSKRRQLQPSSDRLVRPQCRPRDARSISFSREAGNPDFYVTLQIFRCWLSVFHKYCEGQTKHVCANSLQHLPQVFFRMNYFSTFPSSVCLRDSFEIKYWTLCPPPTPCHTPHFFLLVLLDCPSQLRPFGVLMTSPFYH